MERVFSSGSESEVEMFNRPGTHNAKSRPNRPSGGADFSKSFAHKNSSQQKQSEMHMMKKPVPFFRKGMSSIGNRNFYIDPENNVTQHQGKNNFFKSFVHR